MVELCPVPFADLVERIHLEFERQQAVFDLPMAKWFVPDPAGPDLGVGFHDQRAATPVGPASGPHNQMAQNLVLAWLAGSRIIELKTVQILDELDITRPCIHVPNVGYNVEWSQELRIGESLREYVAGAMLIYMIRRGAFFGDLDLSGPHGATIFDMSLGYDLAGIRSEPIRGFVDEMKNATAVVDALRLQIPARYRELRDLDYPTRITNSVTLSTFHGCPTDEIEAIARFLLNELELDVIVKMNPPTLGRERLEHLLHEVMGYHNMAVHPKAYDNSPSFDEAVALTHSLVDVARSRGRSFGVKFSNTLEVVNPRDVFSQADDVMYLSGPALHVVTLTLAARFREAVGPALPISFSAGVDQQNFPDMVAAGFVPVTTCTDLLKPGGYARLPKYLSRLVRQMGELGGHCLDDYILDAHGRRAEAGGDVREAAARNLAIVAEQAAKAPRYCEPANRDAPRRIQSHLTTFDCLTCDKCIPVCPNDANFTYPLEKQELRFHHWKLGPAGEPVPDAPGRMTIDRRHQIANFADFCNECGNCDTFCPEYGGPFIAKPTFFGTRVGYEQYRDHDGFFVEVESPIRRIRGRMQGGVYELSFNADAGTWSFDDGTVRAVFPERIVSEPAVPPSSVRPLVRGHIVDMQAFHTLRLLLTGVLDASRVNPVNVRWRAQSDGTEG